jgi:hypothetical protein
LSVDFVQQFALTIGATLGVEMSLDHTETDSEGGERKETENKGQARLQHDVVVVSEVERRDHTVEDACNVELNE